jgi:serine phosphatase RsbU (regulator of sigma subunit)/CHASE1-domain containing sensor protein
VFPNDDHGTASDLLAATGDGMANWSVAGRRRAIAAILVAILAVGFGASAALARSARHSSANEERAVTMQAAESVRTVARSLVAGLGGANALVPADGLVDESAYRRFADGVVATTEFTVIALVSVVADDDRAQFEAAIGGPIRALSADGTLQPSPTRSSYLAVRWVQPQTEGSIQVIGFDIASAEVRRKTAELAAGLGTIAFSSPIDSQPTGQRSFFVTAPLYRPGVPLDSEAQRRSALAGYMTTAVQATSLIQPLQNQLPTGTRLQILDGQELLATSDVLPQGGQSATVQVPGRTWTIVASYGSPSYLSAGLVALLTVLVALLVGLFLQRADEQSRELRRAADTMRLLGKLSQELADTGSRADVIDVVRRHGGAPVRADLAELDIARLDAAGLDIAHDVAHDVALDSAVDTEADRTAPGLAVITADLTNEARDTDTDVVIVDSSRSTSPAAHALEANGFRAALAVPIAVEATPGDGHRAVLVTAWRRRTTVSLRQRSAMVSIAEMVRQALSRADAQQARRASAAALAELGRDLSSARTLADIIHGVMAHAPAASSADGVAIGLVNEQGTELRIPSDTAAGETASEPLVIPIDPASDFMTGMRDGRRMQLVDAAQIDAFPDLRELLGPDIDRLVCLPLLDSRHELVGVIAYVFVSRRRTHSITEPGRLGSIADLVAQTIERAELHRREHEVVAQLQRKMLADPPVIHGLQIAARYLPASSSVGMGGDWYEVQALDDGTVVVVVGDVVGHGVDAIADMTEIRTAVSTLVRTGVASSEARSPSAAQPAGAVDLGDVVRHASSMLMAHRVDRFRFATAALVQIDPSHRLASCVHAGHPPSMIRHVSGAIEMLDQSTCAPIGVGSPAGDGQDAAAVVTQYVQLERGAVLVVYTDGLIERRDESIDDGLDRLSVALVAAPDTDVEAIADHLVTHCLANSAQDDDAAVVVVRVA